MHAPSSAPPSPPACGISSHSLVEARLSEVAGLRDRGGPPGSPALPARFLRHCDEHAVVGMHAVLAAIASHPGPAASFARHGVVAAPCLAGRIMAARTLAAFASGGPVTVSPHVVPQASLHSIAGAVSVGLGMRGPHLGVGGGPHALAEGLFAALSLVGAGGDGAALPGAWVVATEWDAEPALDAAGAPGGDPVCRALALLVEPAPRARGCTVGGGSGCGKPACGRATRATPSAGLALSLQLADARHGARPGSRLAEFARALEMCREGTALVSWALECPWGAELRVERVADAAGRTAVAPRREAA